MKLKYKMNKKGVLLIPVIIGALALLIITGSITAWKINSIIDSIPTIVWWGIALIVILMLLPKKK